MFKSYKDRKFTFRVITQMLLAGPIFISLPWALMGAIGSVTLMFNKDYTTLVLGVFFIFGSYGLIALYGSIFIRSIAFQNYTRLRRFVIFGLGSGLIIAVSILINLLMQFTFEIDNFIIIYILIGPIIVAIWNIRRIYWKS